MQVRHACHNPGTGQVGATGHTGSYLSDLPSRVSSSEIGRSRFRDSCMTAKVQVPDTWVCPHCNFAQMKSRTKSDGQNIRVNIEGLAEGHVLIGYNASGCVNPKCMKLTISAFLLPASKIATQSGPEYYYRGGPAIGSIRFLPRGSSKPQPPYIPQPLVMDYEEACSIKELSPKASATLVRRCLQGMIRDFCNIRKGTLAQEIKALREAVEAGSGPKGVDIDTVDAIDHVRSIGNIGAHMEKDINIIVDVDADEAQMLIDLVEMLFAEWYVARERRSESLKAIKALSSRKEDDRNPQPLLAGPDTTGVLTAVGDALADVSKKA